MDKYYKDSRGNISVLKKQYTDKNGNLVVETITYPNSIITPKKEKLKGGDFVFVFQQAILNVVLNGNLSKNALRILLYLIAKTEFEKEINITIYSIAKTLKSNQSNISKSLRELVDLGIVIRNKELRTLRLNYEIAFKGNVKSYKKLQFSDTPLLELNSNQTNIFQQIEQELEKNKASDV